MCDRNPQLTLWARRNLMTSEIAVFYKDWLASSDQAIDEV